MAQSSFAAQVGDWVRETKARQTAVYRESAQRVIAAMQVPVGAGGNMPVDTGFLRASLMASLGYTLPPTRDNPGGAVSYDPGAVSLTISRAEISDPITAVYTASYAEHVEYGARGRAGRRFVALAAQQWPRIVSEVATEAQARAGG
tara:strand:+ start:2594 stop:3031 length:438 start_codon:yes stop_codon:yes gene_type:complete